MKFIRSIPTHFHPADFVAQPKYINIKRHDSEHERKTARNRAQNEKSIK